MNPVNQRMARRPILSLPAALLLLLLAAGCGPQGPSLPGADALGPLEAGTPKSEVLNALPYGPLEVTEGDRRVSWGHRRSTYLHAGDAIEVLWVTAPEGAEPEASRSTVNPVIFRNDLLDGWGWDHFETRRAEFGLPAPFFERGETEPSLPQPGAVDPEPDTPPNPPTGGGVTGEG